MQLGTAEVLVKAKTSQFDRDIQKSEGKVIQFGKSADKSVTRAKRAMAGFERSTTRVSGSVTNAMESMAGRAGGLGTTLAGINPVMAGVTAVAVAAGVAIFKSSQLADEWDRALKKTSAVLKSTGYAAGLTAAELDNLAKERDLATLGDKQDILNAINVLLTFKSVQEDTFTRAIELSQDMAAITGQSLTSSVTMLGKALENPIKGLTAMTRVGVTFTDAEAEKIKALTESNRLMDAQAVILDALAGQYGGAAAAEADSLAGSMDTLNFRYREFLETLEQTEAMRTAVDALAGALESMTSAMAGPTPEERKAQLKDEIELLRARVEAAQAANQNQTPDYSYGRGGWGQPGQSPAIKEMQAAQAERLKQLEAEYALLVRNTATEERVAEIQRQAREAAKAGAGTPTATLTDAEMKEREAFLAEWRQATMEQTAYEIDAIERQAKAYREKGYDAAKIDEWKTRKIKDINDKANKDKLDTLAEFDQAYREATMAEIDMAREAAEAQAQAWIVAGADADKVQRWLAKEHEKITDEYADDADEMAEMWEEATDRMTDALEGFVDTGNSEIDSLIMKFAELALQDIYTSSGAGDALGGLFGGLGGGMNDFFASIFHDGGTVGGPAPMRLVDPAVFAGAPRYHDGLFPGERAAILQDGEIVIPRADKLDRVDTAGGRPIVNVYDHTSQGAKVTTQESQGPGGQWQVDIFLEEIDRNIAYGITSGTSRTAQALAGTYGANRAYGGR